MPASVSASGGAHASAPRTPLSAAAVATAAGAAGRRGLPRLGGGATRCAPSPLRRVEVPVLAPGARPLRVLHISDLHLTPGQQAKREWVALARRSRARPGRSTPATTWPTARRCRPCSTRSARCSSGPAPSSWGPTTTTSRRSRTRRATCCRSASRGCASTGCRPTTCATGCSPPAGSTSTTPASGSRPTTARSSWSAPTTPTSGTTATHDVAGPADPAADLVDRRHPRPVPPRPGPDGRRRLPARARRPHPRRPALRAVPRRAGHQLRPAAPAGEGPLDPRARPGAVRACTSPPASARRRTRRCASPAAPEATLLTLVPREA